MQYTLRLFCCTEGISDFLRDTFHALDDQFFLAAFDFVKVFTGQSFLFDINQMSHKIEKQETGLVQPSDNHIIRAILSAS